ncbi:MAG TPA: 50S ribosomal protein L9 [Gemmataceae bacterium]|nr:50S ribosomal protein L9 [Gemmataceae bacterium]
MATKTKKAAPKKPPEAVKPQKKVKRRNQPLKGKHGGWQLVLIEDVTHLGKQGDVVEVKPGYARNYLLPNSLATVPTPHNLKLLDKYKIRVQQAREARIADLKVLAEQIQRVNVTVEANATEEGHLYGSVGPAEVAKALRGRNLPVEPEMVHMDGPIKELGLFAVKLNLGYDIESEVKVLVNKPQEAPAAKR